MDLTSAEKACNEKAATLFVANSLEEFDQVMKEAPKYYWSWIGLGQGEEDTFPKWQVTGAGSPPSMRCLPSEDVPKPTWDGLNGMDPSELNWLVKPFSSVTNGWSKASMCVGYYNVDVGTTYLYFFPCSSKFHSVCERNSTATNI